MLYKEGAVALKFFTVWNYCLLWVLFAIGSLVSIRNSSQNTEVSTLDKIFVVLVEVELPVSLMVTVVFWTVLFPEERPHQNTTWRWFDNISEHVFNFVLILFEFLSNRILLYPERWSFAICWTCLYALFALTYDKIQNDGTYIYPFLDSSSPHSIPWFLGICILVLAVHYMMCILSSLKQHFLVLPMQDHEFGVHGSTLLERLMGDS